MSSVVRQLQLEVFWAEKQGNVCMWGWAGGQFSHMVVARARGSQKAPVTLETCDLFPKMVIQDK